MNTSRLNALGMSVSAFQRGKKDGSPVLSGPFYFPASSYAFPQYFLFGGYSLLLLWGHTTPHV